MWKNGKEGNTEGRRIMEGKDERRETRDERRLKRKKKRSQGKGGMWQAREGERQDRKEKERKAGSGRNVVGKTEWEETK